MIPIVICCPSSRKGGTRTNARLYQFFQLLSSQPGRQSYEQLAQQLSVSTRTIRNYALSLSACLEELGFTDCLNNRENGLSYSGTPDETLQIQQHLSGGDFYDYHLSSEERLFTITLLLLGSDGYLTVNKLAELLFVSRNTILNDMEKARRSLQARGIQFDRHLNRGYRLDLDEAARREQIFTLCAPHLGRWSPLQQQTGIFPQQLEIAFHVSELCPDVCQIVQELEANYALSVSDTLFQQVVFQFCIIALRLLQGHTLPEQADSEIPRDTHAYQIALDAARRLEQRFGTALPAQEVDALALVLQKRHFLSAERMEHSEDIHLFLIVHQFLQGLSADLQCDFSKDVKLMPMLLQHIQEMEYAPPSDPVPLSPEELFLRYPKWHAALLGRITPLEAVLGRSFSETDIALLLVHILASAERLSKDMSTPQIVVVCHVGVGTGHFLAERLQDIFNLRVIRVTSTHQLPRVLEQEMCDLVVSTVPLKGVSCRWIQVSPQLDGESALRLKRELLSLRKEKRDTLSHAQTLLPRSYPVIPLAPDAVQLDLSCSDWVAAIRAASRPLIHSGAILPRYVDAMLNCVRINGPYFVFIPGVALAHASPSDGVNRLCCSFLRLKEPVTFGHRDNDPVRFVLVLGITDAKLQVDRVSALMHLLTDPETFHALQTAGRDEVQALLRRQCPIPGAHPSGRPPAGNHS